MKRVPQIQRKRRSYWQNWVDEIMEDGKERSLKGIIQDVILKKGTLYVPQSVRLSKYLRSNPIYVYHKPKQYTIFRRVD
tara:strand:- start:1066 stop:1302 length:237 start_codon:yes stop_codon:yes gene_type:complete